MFSLVHKRYNNNKQKLSLLYKDRDRSKEVEGSGFSYYECIYNVCGIVLIALVVLIAAKTTLDKVIRPQNDK